MKVTVQFFSFLRQLTGQTELPVELPAHATVGDLVAHLGKQFPGLEKSTALVAVGMEFSKPADAQN